MAGSTDYSLVCDITTIPSLSDTPPSVTWTLPSAATTETGATVASGGQNYVSRLPLTPLTGDHEGEYTCTTLNGATYSASDTYTVGELFSPNTHPSSYVTSVVLEMSVEVRGSGRGGVGTVYTLTCTVTLSHRARDSSVSIQWQGPSTDDQQTVDRITEHEVLVTDSLIFRTMIFRTRTGGLC